MSIDKGKVIYSEEYQLFGISLLEVRKLIEAKGFKSVEWVLTNETGVVEIRIKSEHLRAFNRVKKQMVERFSEYLLIGPNQTYPQLLVETLIKQHLWISSAESMTGGLISALITGIENASKVLKESYVVYSDEAKMKLVNVQSQTLNEYGVTSKEVALEMVEGLSRLTNSDICISVTGVAGPTSDNLNTPVGTVFIGIKILENIQVLSCFFTGDRESIQRQAAMTAIATIYKELKD
ncbi:MAG: CinA family protein [Firmicutes bacterium]|nr:CinA family protein [Bacillota bacterium]